MKTNQTLNASHEAIYTDSKFKLYPVPESLDLEKLYKDRMETSDPGWFYYRKLYMLINTLPKGRVLDLACGAGFLSVYLAKAGHSVFAVDISEEAIRYARAIAMANDCIDKIEFKVMDTSKLDYPDNYFDIVTGEDCLHHILKYNGTLSNIHRVMKTDGVGLFFEPFGFNPIVNILRKINLFVSKRKFENVLRKNDLYEFRQKFSRVILSEYSVIYKVPKRFVSFTKRHPNFCLKFHNADIALQRAIPVIRKFCSAAFIELYKS